jgi:hypothetical protein
VENATLQFIPVLCAAVSPVPESQQNSGLQEAFPLSLNHSFFNAFLYCCPIRFRFVEGLQRCNKIPVRFVFRGEAERSLFEFQSWGGFHYGSSP